MISLNISSNKLKVIIAIIFILTLINIFIFTSDKKENFTGTLSIDAAQNVAKLYNSTSGTVTFNNLIVTGNFNLLPKGSIIAFNNPTAPAGWAVCDGNNGTPDLRGRFIRSWGGARNAPIKIATESDWIYNTSNRADENKVGQILNHGFGEYGGTDVRVQHVSEMAKHTHPATKFDGNNTCACGKGKCACGMGSGTTDAAGNAWGMGIQPPYYVLTYIMKL